MSYGVWLKQVGLKGKERKRAWNLVLSRDEGEKRDWDGLCVFVSWALRYCVQVDEEMEGVGSCFGSAGNFTQMYATQQITSLERLSKTFITVSFLPSPLPLPSSLSAVCSIHFD